MKQFTKNFLKFEKHQMLEKLRRACVHHTKLGYGLKKKKKKFVPQILLYFSFSVPQSHSGLEWHGGEKITMFLLRGTILTKLISIVHSILN